MFTEQTLLIQILLISSIFRTCLGQRRIVEGKKVPNDVRFMAYLVKSERSERSYHGWTCGGAIITPQHILTAAACVMDVDHLYAIVGYNKYVSADALEDDPCTRKRKKRVIKTCAPKTYNLLLSGWTNHDIGVATLESALDFTDATYKIDCSYPPALIRVNFDPQYETPDMDVVAMGWGHSKKMRMPHHLQDHNERFLHEVSLLTVKREVCEEKFDYDPNVERIIEDDIICVQGDGLLNGEGSVVDYGSASSRYKCDFDTAENVTTEASNDTVSEASQNATTKASTTNTKTDLITDVETKGTTDTNTNETTQFSNNTSTNETTTEKSTDMMTIKTNTTEINRKLLRTSSQEFFDYDDDEAYDELFKRMGTRRNFCRRRMDTRRGGLCQNDHGGPLIAWMGVNPIVIGVASTNLYNKEYACISPNLFTSTMKNEWFIKCAINEDDPETFKTCKEMATRKGISINVEISNWLPNSTIQNRPRINPIQDLQNALRSYLVEPKKYEHQNGPHKKSLSNYEKHLLNQQKIKNRNQHNSLQQASFLLQNLLNYAKDLQTEQINLHDYQKFIETHQQNEPMFNESAIHHFEPNHQQDSLSYQHNKFDLQQRAPSYQLAVPNQPQRAPSFHDVLNHQQFVPSYHHNVPNFQQSVPNHQQFVPNLEQGVPNQPRQAFSFQQILNGNYQSKSALKLRPQKTISEVLAASRKKTTKTAPKSAIPRLKLTTRGKSLKRRKTITWRRNVHKNNEIVKSTTIAIRDKSTKSQMVIRIRV